MTTLVENSSDRSTAQADQLRQQMRAVRRELGQNVGEIVEHAEQLMDWRYYVRRYPWATVGAAALAGYLVVPRRSPVWPTSGLRTVRSPESWSAGGAVPPEAASKPGIASSLLSMATNLAMRAALAYVGQQAGKLLGQHAAASAPAEMPDPVSRWPD